MSSESNVRPETDMTCCALKYVLRSEQYLWSSSLWRIRVLLINIFYYLLYHATTLRKNTTVFEEDNIYFFIYFVSNVNLTLRQYCVRLPPNMKILLMHVRTNQDCYDRSTILYGVIKVQRSTKSKLGISILCCAAAH